MRPFVLAPLLLLAAACSQSPQAKQIDQIEDQADEQADAIVDAARQRAEPLETRATQLREQARQAGGFDGKRLEVEAEASEKQAGLIRDQAREQAQAVKAAANAKVQALESR
jgi:phage-related minor tail protein